MASQTTSGKAFEYALLIAAYKRANDGREARVLKKDGPYETAKRSFESCAGDAQEKYSKAANAAVGHIAALEPRLENPAGGNSKVVVSVQPDQTGKNGDIRDVLVTRPGSGWEIGFSAKNQNSAVKHPRLSDKIDFGKEWFGMDCSPQYMGAVRKIFGNVRNMVNESKKDNGRVLLWNEMLGKADKFYVPVLDAFEDEMKRFMQKGGDTPSLLLEYLLGKKDFYKIMKYNESVIIQGYNMNGTLNMPSSSTSAQNKISSLKSPSRIVDIERVGKNRMIIMLNHGWQISFRIHNASSKAEPSLKFDVRLEGMPPDLYSHTERW